MAMDLFRLAGCSVAATLALHFAKGRDRDKSKLRLLVVDPLNSHVFNKRISCATKSYFLQNN